ncbi:hypothetical protein PLUTE_a3526 [Pseudoalteromonas luteoviolacea DSM 6061]|nr:hypothetical protein [Pseudoalteromonas luteoviolacea DSM 6061]
MSFDFLSHRIDTSLLLQVIYNQQPKHALKWLPEKLGALA